MDAGNKPVDAETFRHLKHDIKNQISNIQLAIEGLKYDIADNEADLELYIDSIIQSAKQIDDLLNNIK